MKLEIGCGGGTYQFNPKICPNCEDNIFGDIERIRGLTATNFLVLDAQHLPFKANSFKEIYLSHVIEHLNYPTKAIEDAHRVLSKNGKVHVWTPNFIDSTATFDKTHKHVYNVFKLRRLLKSCGFQVHSHVISIGSRLGFLKPIIQYALLMISAELYVVGERQ